MASRLSEFFGAKGRRYTKSKQPDIVERICGLLALSLLGFVGVAVARGRDQWSEIPWQVWLHLTTISAALAITPFMMLRRRGDRLHRMMGWVWAALLLITALVSFNMRFINPGGFSLIHILSVLTLIGVPVLVISARRHDIQRHRSQARGFVVGALLLAGFFTFPFNRLLGSWLFG